MSELRLETWTMPAADLGPQNPLPPLKPARDVHEITDAPGVPDDMVRNMTYGRVDTPLPYTMQDRYDRNKVPRDFRVAVLENETLRATFLLEMGGRLWSLYHRPSDRELLSVNPVFQPANLAIRNAWFSGGVEWNIGTIGHCPFTCSPLFAARAERDDGTPVLRMYEWERIRRTPFQIDAYLPDGSPVLFVRVRITNPHDEETPMYWWSNMAAPESPETRVIAPATSAYSFGYQAGSLFVAPIPEVDGTDVSYTTNVSRAADFFFHIPDGERHWITALDGQGKGLVQASTPMLQGRKLFLWGMGSGGRTWQTFLSQPDVTYLEIQAGLARTQTEHLRMPPHAEWTWLEAYGLMEADADDVHGRDWAAAQQAVQGPLDTLISEAELKAEHQASAGWSNNAPIELLQTGSGWGMLEQLRLEASGNPVLAATSAPVTEADLDKEQAPWLALLKDGAFPDLDPNVEPLGYLVQDEWRDLLEQSIANGRSQNWSAWYHLGVMRYYVGDFDGARSAWITSMDLRPTPWAGRNLALLAQLQGDLSAAADGYVAACRQRPSLQPLAAECGVALIQSGRPDEWLALLADLPDSVRHAGRIRLLEAQAALAVKDFDRVEHIFADPPVVADLREGERSLSQLWFEFHEQRICAEEGRSVDETLRARVRREFPVPQVIDFRMSLDEPTTAE